MENQNKKKSIWGDKWAYHRPWLYTSWLGTELSIRFYKYAKYVHEYLENHQDDIVPYIGEIGSKTLDILLTGTTFTACSAFLTIPACFILYKFFKEDNLTNTKLEEKIKKYL